MAHLAVSRAAFDEAVPNGTLQNGLRLEAREKPFGGLHRGGQAKKCGFLRLLPHLRVAFPSLSPGLLSSPAPACQWPPPCAAGLLLPRHRPPAPPRTPPSPPPRPPVSCSAPPPASSSAQRAPPPPLVPPPRPASCSAAPHPARIRPGGRGRLDKERGGEKKRRGEGKINKK